MKKIFCILTVILLAALCLPFTAFASTEGVTYYASSCVKNGERYVYKGDYLVLNDNGTGTLRFNDDIYTLTDWHLTGTSFTATDNRDSQMIGTLDGGRISATYRGYEYTYDKGEPAAVMSYAPDRWGGDLPVVFDKADILSADEEAKLTERINALAAAHNCAIYALTMKDFQSYTDSGNVETCGREIRAGYSLGYGAEKNCILLMLSMADRDYAIVCYGDKSNAAFTDYAKEKLASKYFLKGFRDNNWYKGFSLYLDGCDDMLLAQENGAPIDTNNDPRERSVFDVVLGIIVSFLLGMIPAAIFCGSKKKKMQSVALQSKADSYVPQGGVEITYRADNFMFTTTTRTYSPRSSSSGGGGGGGTHVGGGGHSSSSGKF